MESSDIAAESRSGSGKYASWCLASKGAIPPHNHVGIEKRVLLRAFDHEERKTENGETSSSIAAISAQSLTLDFETEDGACALKI